MSVGEQKREIMCKIENCLMGLVDQILSEKKVKTVRLRISDNEEDPVIQYKRNHKKLAHDIGVLSQVHCLLRNNQSATKRALYYDQKSLYGVQTKFDRSLTNVCRLLDCERALLNVLSCSKGLLMGALSLLPPQESVIDCRKQILLIAESFTSYRPISTATFILVVEKDASFQRLVEDGYFEQFPNSILVTGKGYPDIYTRKFLRWLLTVIDVPIFGLFDADPHGMEIYLTYKYGSSVEKAEGRGAFVRNIQWLGVKPSEIAVHGVERDQYLPLKNADYRKITRLRRRAEGLGELELVRELDILREQKHKFEIEAISSLGSRYLPHTYLRPKLTHVL